MGTWRNWTLIHFWCEYIVVWLLWKTTLHFFKIVNLELPNCPVIPLLHMYPGVETLVYPKTSTWMFLAISFHNPKVEITQVSINLQTIQCINWIEYYLPIKRNVVHTHATTQMTPEIIRLSERGQTQKITQMKILFIRKVQNQASSWEHP
jgi:hypothetical protein